MTVASSSKRTVHVRSPPFPGRERAFWRGCNFPRRDIAATEAARATLQTDGHGVRRGLSPPGTERRISRWECPRGLPVSNDAPPGDARSRLSEFAMPPVQGVVVGYPAFRVRLSGLRKSAIRFAQAGYPIRVSRIPGSRAARSAFTWPLCATLFGRKARFRTIPHRFAALRCDSAFLGWLTVSSCFRFGFGFIVSNARCVGYWC